VQRISSRAGQRRGHQLLGEKRVTLGAGEQVIGKPRRRRGAHQRGDLLRRLAPRQRPQPDLLHPASAAHMRQPARHLRIQRHLIAAARHHHCQRARTTRPRQVGQAIQRRAIGPVHILDHRYKPAGPGHRA
jgi:hypothetical protein